MAQFARFNAIPLFDAVIVPSSFLSVATDCGLPPRPVDELPQCWPLPPGCGSGLPAGPGVRPNDHRGASAKVDLGLGAVGVLPPSKRHRTTAPQVLHESPDAVVLVSEAVFGHKSWWIRLADSPASSLAKMIARYGSPRLG